MRSREDPAGSPSTPSSGKNLKGLIGRELGRELKGCVKDRVRRSSCEEEDGLERPDIKEQGHHKLCGIFNSLNCVL